MGAGIISIKEKIMKLLSSKKELNDSLMDLIKNSDKKLIIISPYIDFWGFDENNRKIIWTDLINLLKEKEKVVEFYTYHKSVDTIKKHLNIKENNIIPIHNLHAKIYINDDTILLSSMNLMFSSFNKSIDFGIIIKNNEAEYNNLLDYCNNNIFIYNPKHILDSLPKDIDSKFDKYLIYLTLNNNNNLFVVCHTDKFNNDVYFYFNIPRNTPSEKLFTIRHNIGKKYGFNIKCSSQKGLTTKKYHFPLENIEYPHISTIPVINTPKYKILGFLIDVYNCLNE